MKRTMGSGFGALAFLAFTIHSAFPPAAERAVVSSTETSKQEHKQKSKIEQAEKKPEPPQLEGPWLATRSFFSLASPQRPPDPADSLNRQLADDFSLDRSTGRSLLGVPSEDYEIQTMVAAVVDPVHTHLPLFFDQQMEAIESAAERQGWEFSSQWLPWAISRPSSEDSLDDRLAEKQFERDQEGMPGVLVFRHQEEQRSFPNKCLLIFLVPETPTAGIAAAPFKVAMNLALAASDNGKVGILAPTFSGSFESLTRLVKLWPALQKLGRPVFSGTASSSTRANLFYDATKIGFHGGVSPIEADKKAFVRVLDRLSIDQKHAAYLVEGESGYANEFIQPAGIVTYRYPRDIANLRNAYQEAADPAKDKSQSPVDFTMKDRSHGEDTIPIFSDTHTPVLQSALLASICKDFRRNKMQIVYVVATNNLDALFLARIIHRGSPDTRVLIGGGDLLFVPAASQESTTGTLFLSAYPLFLQGSKWMSANDGHVHTFPSANFQGLFIVSQQLLQSMGSGTDKVDAPGFGQFPPNAAKPFPGLWLLTLTRAGLEPLDWFENEIDTTKKDQKVTWFDRQSCYNTPRGFIPPDPPLGWSVTVAGFGGLALVAGLFILGVTFSIPVPLWVRLKEGNIASALTLLSACCSLSLPVFLLSVPVWGYVRNGPSEVIGIIALGLVALFPLVAAVLTIRRTFTPSPARYKLIAAAILAFYGFLLFIWSYCCWRNGAPSHLLFRYRAIDLYSGASPTAPLLIFCLVFLIRSIMLFRRYSEVAWDGPRLSLPDDVKLHSYVRTHFVAVEEHLRSGIERLQAGIKAPVVWRYALSGVLVIACLLPFWSSVRAFEESPYTWSIRLALALVMVSIIVSCRDLIHLWLNLRAMLVLLEVSPLRSAITRVARQWPRQAVWALWRSISRQRLAAQMLLALHNRYQCQQTVAGDYATFRELSEVRFAAPKKDDPSVYEALRKYEDKCADLAAEILKEDLVPYWDRSKLDDNGEPRTPDEETLADNGVKSSADFVALQFCNYILFAVRHTQRLAWSISTSLLLLILALASYHAQSPQLLGRIIVLAFVGFGGVIWWVLSGMERNWVLSRIGRTKPGELNLEFWGRLASVVILPLSAVLVHLFPTFSGLLSNVITPGLEALK